MIVDETAAEKTYRTAIEEAIRILDADLDAPLSNQGANHLAWCELTAALDDVVRMPAPP